MLKGPLDLEIGAGAGLHAVQYCSMNPERTLLAVERTHAKAARLLSRRQRHPALTGLVPLHADAVSIVTHELPDASLERIFILYPNPYPKTKQANQRFHNMPFMGELLRKLKQGGELHLATNLEWYADEAQSRLQEVWKLSLKKRARVQPGAPRTHFEKKYLARNETCYDLIFTKDN